MPFSVLSGKTFSARVIKQPPTNRDETGKHDYLYSTVTNEYDFDKLSIYTVRNRYSLATMIYRCVVRSNLPPTTVAHRVRFSF